jgi:hypothetical protein
MRNAVREANLHNQCQGECHGNKKMSSGDITRLEDVMVNEQTIQLPREGGEREEDVQDGHVTEEYAYEQRADRCGYHGGVHAPRRGLLENT